MGLESSSHMSSKRGENPRMNYTSQRGLPKHQRTDPEELDLRRKPASPVRTGVINKSSSRNEIGGEGHTSSKIKR